MTRFIFSLDAAVDLVLDAAKDAKHGELWIRKMPAATVETLAAACMPEPGYPTEVIGIRPGEKMHETLVCEDEMRRAVETDTHFVVYPDAARVPGVPLIDHPEYTSANTERLDVDGVRRLLREAGLL